MDKKYIEDKVVEQYQQDERMMILIFAQWCINKQLNPIQLYQEAYPNQANNTALEEVMELTVTKEESDTIPDDSLLHVLQLFGNDDLAIVVTSYIHK